MGAWTVGHNVAGYSPESDVFAVAEWQAAAGIIRDDLVNLGDALADQYGENSDEVAEIDAAIADLDSSPYGEDWLRYIGAGNCLDTAYWITYSADAYPEED